MVVTRTLTYVPALDGLRAVAIAFVLLTHFAQPLVVPGGFGVDVFFVLSGFLITTLLWQELARRDTVVFRSFYLKRAIRLAPALIITVAVTMIVMPLLGETLRQVGLQSVSALLYLIPFSRLVLGDTAYYGHLWTLAVEEYFYLAWPLILLVLWRAKVRWQRIAAWSIGLGVALYVLRGLSPLLLGAELQLLRVGGIAIGCGIALVIAETGWRGPRRALSVATAALLAAAFLAGWNERLMGFAYLLSAAAGAAAVFVIMGTQAGWLQRVLELRPMVFLGKISYELYLVHMIVMLPLAYLTGLPRYVAFWFVTPLALAAAAGLHYALLPLQKRWRSRLGGRGV